MDIKDKRVVITGAASGIGRSMAFAFHKAGASSILVSDINETGAEEVSKEVKGLFKRTDVTDEKEISDLVSTAQKEFGGIDIFCSNVGVGSYEDFLETTGADWARMLNVNLMSHIHSARSVLPGMLQQGSGYFVFTASAAGLLSQIGSATYSVTKHAVVSFAEWLKISYGKSGIGVSCSCPQFVRTPMTEGMPDSPGSDNIIEPEIVANDVINAISNGKFLVTPHPEVLEYLQYKVSDYDAWISGMQDLKDKFFPKLKDLKK